MNNAIEITNSIDYIQAIKNKIADPTLRESNKMNSEDFTRTRKLPFNRMIGLMLNKSEHSITSRLNLGYEKLFPNDLDAIPTSSAFVQARKKISPQVFVDLLDYSNTLFYQNLEQKYEIKTWKGHNLLAVDGSRFTIPVTDETEPKFSRMKSRNLPAGVLQGITVSLYDSLNNLPLKATFGKVETEKKPFFKEHIPFIKEGPLADYLQDPILIFDRLFIDFSMFSMLLANNLKFCIRSKTSATFKVITDFVNSSKKDTILEFKCPYSQKAFVEKNEFLKVIKLRAVKVTLCTGEIEILITNLVDKEKYPRECFKELYFKRWRVEVSFSFLKVFMSIEKFSSSKLQSILQDFHSCIFLYSFCEMLKIEEDKLAQANIRSKSRKYEYQVSISNLITAVQNHVIELMLLPELDLRTLYLRLSRWIQSEMSPIRPDRSFKRPRRSDSKSLVYRILSKRAHS